MLTSDCEIVEWKSLHVACAYRKLPILTFSRMIYTKWSSSRSSSYSWSFFFFFVINDYRFARILLCDGLRMYTIRRARSIGYPLASIFFMIIFKKRTLASRYTYTNTRVYFVCTCGTYSYIMYVIARVRIRRVYYA